MPVCRLQRFTQRAAPMRCQPPPEDARARHERQRQPSGTHGTSAKPTAADESLQRRSAHRVGRRARAHRATAQAVSVSPLRRATIARPRSVKRADQRCPAVQAAPLTVGTSSVDQGDRANRLTRASDVNRSSAAGARRCRSAAPADCRRRRRPGRQRFDGDGHRQQVNPGSMSPGPRPPPPPPDRTSQARRLRRDLPIDSASISRTVTSERLNSI